MVLLPEVMKQAGLHTLQELEDINFGWQSEKVDYIPSSAVTWYLSVCLFKSLYFMRNPFLQDCSLKGGGIQAAWRGAEAHQRADPERKRSPATSRRPHAEKYVCSCELTRPSLLQSWQFHIIPKPRCSEPLCFPALVVSARPQQPPGSLRLTKYYSHDRL